jgi:hypothetical protein
MPAIGVYARLRPAAEDKPGGSGGEIAQGAIVIKRTMKPVFKQDGIQIRNLEFQLNWVFNEQAKQKEIYEIVGKERVSQVLKGFNVCILAYGQTGSGKTHTMFGPDEVLQNYNRSNPELHGVALRAMSDLFEEVAPKADRYAIQASYIEVYNDGCNDLLGAVKGRKMVEGVGGVQVIGLLQEEVTNLPEAMALQVLRAPRRAYGAHRLLCGALVRPSGTHAASPRRRRTAATGSGRSRR